MKKIVVRVPATSANLGPGFDCLGIALNLWNTFELSERGAGDARRVVVETIGEGAGKLPSDETHLVAQIFLQAIDAERADLKNTRWHIRCTNNVPCGSGLGSSSTAALGGLLLAHAALHPNEPTQRVLDAAIAYEGHGDNVAPALMGGLIIVSSAEGAPIVHRVPTPPMRVVVCVPEFDFLTTAARGVLPQNYSRADAIYNIGRAMLIVEALRNADDTLLARAMGDRIHEPYRMKIVPGAIAAKQAALDAGAIAVALSGAGPGMIAFARNQHEAIGAAMQRAFAGAGLRARYWALDVSESGATVIDSSF